MNLGIGFKSFAVFGLIFCSFGSANLLGQLAPMFQLLAKYESQNHACPNPTAVRPTINGQSIFPSKTIPIRLDDSAIGPGRQTIVRPSTLVREMPQKDQALQAIAEVRQRVGGVASHLSDIVPKGESEAIFQQELEKLQLEKGEIPSQTNRDPLNLAAKEQRAALVPISNEINAIRTISMNLDQLAGQLEQLSRYTEADDLRRQAQALRESVRK